jgi:hypothetical protein
MDSKKEEEASDTPLSEEKEPDVTDLTCESPTSSVPSTPTTSTSSLDDPMESPAVSALYAGTRQKARQFFRRKLKSSKENWADHAKERHHLRSSKEKLNMSLSDSDQPSPRSSLDEKREKEKEKEKHESPSSKKSKKRQIQELEEAYWAKCQEVFLLQQQLQIYQNKFGRISDMEEVNLLIHECNSQAGLELSSTDDCTPPETVAVVPIRSLTKQQTKTHQLHISKSKQLAHSFKEVKKPFGKRDKLFTVHNRTGRTLFVSVYDKLRVGVASHVRISPVFKVDSRHLSFLKPYPIKSRTRWLLFCSSARLFPENLLTMNDSMFKSIPKFSIDFRDEIYITVDETDGSLRGWTKLNWKTVAKSPKERKSGPIMLAREPVVRKGTELGPEEIQFLAHRALTTTQALEHFLGVSLDQKYIPRIAFCGSGGGCRAMVSTVGSLLAAEEMGLLDCFSYVSGVSGSTWAVGLWLTLGNTIAELKENIKEKFQAGLISRPSKQATMELMKIMTQKWSTDKKVGLSLVDLYSALLSVGFLYDASPAGSAYKLSHQIPRVIDGNKPLPLYTAVQKRTDGKHDWFEFSPFEVGSCEFKSFVPSWCFGRNFSQGKLQGEDRENEPSFGMLLSMFGSAFCAPLERASQVSIPFNNKRSLLSAWNQLRECGLTVFIF